MKTRSVIAALIVAAAGAATSATAQVGEPIATVVITEMFASTNQVPNFRADDLTVPFGIVQERLIEFVEIYNYGDQPVSLNGWTLTDDGTTQTFPAMDLMPGETAVLFGTASTPEERIPELLDGLTTEGDDDSFRTPGDFGNGGTEDTTTETALNEPSIFEAAFSGNPEGPFKTIYLQPFESLANGPSPTDEILELRNADGDLVDEVNFDDSFPWPVQSPDGTSIVLLPEFVRQDTIDAVVPSGLPFDITPQLANDNGLAWADSNDLFEGGFKVDGAYFSLEVIFDLAVLEAGLMQDPPVVDIDLLYVGPVEDLPEEIKTDPDAFQLVPGAQVLGTNANFVSPGNVDIIPDDVDANENGIDDDVDILLGQFGGFGFPGFNDSDVNRNYIPDVFELATGDCNNNGQLDDFESTLNRAVIDANFNAIPDTCEIADNPALDMNGNDILDEAELGNVIISEIGATTTAASEPATEWIEIYNAGDTPVDVSGWGFMKLDAGPDAYDYDFTTPDTLPDVNSPESFTEGLPAGTMLAPGEAIVLVEDVSPDNFNNVEFAGIETRQDVIDEWQAAWGDDLRVFPLAGFGFIANNASPGNEILALYAPPLAGTTRSLNAGGLPTEIIVVDEVDWDPGAFNDLFQPELINWPGLSAGKSNYLRADSFDKTANNFGGNWDIAIAGVDGATRAAPAGPAGLWDTLRTEASPGVVAVESDATGVSEVLVNADGIGSVIISEIFAVPNTPEIDTGLVEADGTPVEAQPQNEWVEITNISGGTVDVSGWYLNDEDGFTSAIPEGTTLAPGESAVIFGTDRSVLATDGFSGNIERRFAYECPADAIQQFYDAWQGGFQVIAVDSWGFDLDPLGFDSDSINQLSNDPGIANEVLTLRNANDELVDLVNWDDEADPRGTSWPLDGTGEALAPAFSIAYLGPFTNNEDNNDGGNWTATLVGADAEARFNQVTPFFFSDFDLAGEGTQEASPGLRFNEDPANINLADIPPFPGCPCNAADLASPPGVLNSSDINAFVAAVLAGNLGADLAAPFGIINSSDINAFVAAFLAGCP